MGIFLFGYLYRCGTELILYDSTKTRIATHESNDIYDSSLSTANFFRSSIFTLSSARAFVALSTTWGTFLSSSPVLASNASFQRATHKHHLHPSLTPA